MTQIQRDPATQPSAMEPRLAWRAWEQLWEEAAVKSDIHLLAQLVGEGIDTPEKQSASERVFTHFAEQPQRYCGKMMRLLLRKGANIPSTLVAPLCACGVRAIRTMHEHGVDLTCTNLAGENALSMVCTMRSEDQFIKSWRYLRERGLDPHATDDCLETAMDAADRYGKTEIVARLESQLETERQAQALDRCTAKTGAKPQKSRL